MTPKVMKLAGTLARTYYERNTAFLEICQQIADALELSEQERIEFISLAVAGRLLIGEPDV